MSSRNARSIASISFISRLAISARCNFNCFSSLAVVVVDADLDGDDFLLVDVNLILSTAESFLVFAAVAVAVVFDAADDIEGEDFFIGEMLGVVEEAVAAEEAAGIAVAAAGGAAAALSLFGAAD